MQISLWRREECKHVPENLGDVPENVSNEVFGGYQSGKGLSSTEQDFKVK